jgi:hypothetical protein
MLSSRYLDLAADVGEVLASGSSSVYYLKLVGDSCAHRFDPQDKPVRGYGKPVDSYFFYSPKTGRVSGLFKRVKGDR